MKFAKYAVIAVFSLVVGFVAANLIYPKAAGAVIVSMAAVIFILVSAQVGAKEA